MLPYRYGCNGLFNAHDIEPCEEPRIRQNHTIAVGCLVQRGTFNSNLKVFANLRQMNRFRMSKLIIHAIVLITNHKIFNNYTYTIYIYI